ncbi:ankyrin-2-like isoform X2 [Venturia canescens]|uniref:ankyrin-2-like isoform X2 n=1 Tax=Venturia canescens TaxID=32260 RepID=UPI001C9C72C3|nr:ankyrin-2-like isoform X2 [Venturia canescens]
MTTDAEFPPIISLETDDTTAFLRAARSGNLERVIEYLDTNLDINTANSNGLNAMDLASKDGHVEIVTELLKRGAKVDAATKKGNTALHIASLAGQTEIVRILIQYGASVNIQSQNGFTPLYMAAQENHDQVVKLLLSSGANQSLATEDGFTPLAVAMQQGHDKVVSVLLENDSKGKVRLPALHIAAKKDDCKAADLLLQNDHKPDVTSKSGFTPLHIAAHYGNEEIARLLIKRGADVNYLAKHNISPLHVAAKWGKNNMVKILLENSASIDAKTRDGLTPLHCAARSGHEEVVSTLLEHEAPISARTKNGLAPLHMASQGDHVDAARVLLYHRAPVDEVTIDYLTSLHVAAHCGHVRVAKLLLDRKADPNARALNGFTPLHIACKKNRIKVVELLLKHGASIESTTESGLTPLHVASFMGCMNIVIFLLQHEANPDVPTVRGETPLHLAARANQTDIIRILLRNGAKVDARAREEQTPLHIASRLGNVDIVMLLLQHGAAVDTTTKDMYTALHIAAKEGQEEVAAILVENHASVKAATKNGFTPLHIAAKYGNMNVAKILLQKDSKLDAQGKNNITPLHLACHYDHSNVANMILEKGASPHLASQNGHTPLHISARKNQMDIASTLLEHGADPNVQSKAGFTPLQLSAQKGHYDMTNLLIEHGADPNHKAKNGLTALHLCAQEDFIRVASVLVKNGANVESETETGYRPIHVAAHFGNLSMIRFLLKHNAQIDVRTNQNYTPLHQAAQQGHAHIVSALLEGNASHNARTADGLTALNVAQKLGYISVMEVLKGLSYDTLTPDNRTWEEKYKVIAPESLQETSFMSDSDDEGVSDGLVNEQPYRYLTADLMKSLRDDSLPIDVTRDDPIHRQVSKEEKQEFVQSNNYCLAENFDTNDSASLARLHFRSFLVSFLVDARGGAMKGCRHSGIRIIVPPRRATMPIRVTCRLMKPSKVANPPSLMEGEALATRIIEMGPVGASFLGPVLIDVPHFASVQGKEREIIILRSENGETWKEHDNSPDNDDTLFNTPHDPQLSASHNGRITRILTTEFPQYFAIVTRIKQEVHVIGADGGILISSVANHVQAVFPPGALTKKIKVGLQAHVIPTELTAKLLGNCVAVSPVITIEPRRRKFHKPITLTIPVPQAANKGMINQYGGETPTLRLLCSIAGGTSEAQWEDVTGSTPLTFMNDRVSFTTTVSARFWLMDCRNISEVPKMATELYKESLFVPYITNFVIYTKRMDVLEATLRILCMTDGKEGIHTLERQEEFLEIVKSRDVEALDGKDLYIEFSGNLVPVTKSGVQLKFTFKAFRQNRLSFHVKVRDPLLDPVARMMFMRDPKVAKGEPAQQPICVLNIVLPENINQEENKNREYEDSNVTERKIDRYESAYTKHEGEKGDRPKSSSPSESKFITDILQKEQTDAATIHESFAQKAASPIESVDASYPSNVSHRDELSPTNEKQTYTEKRKFWEDITRKRENYQRSESEMSRTSQITVNESDSECCIQNIVSEEETAEIVPERSETMEDLNIPDISECSVAEKAHYFEEQIQKELSTSRPTSKLITQESIKEQFAKLPSNLSGQSAPDRADKVKWDTEIDRKIEKDDWNLSESIRRDKFFAGDDCKFEKTRSSLREHERNEAKTLDIDAGEDSDQQEPDQVSDDKIKEAEENELEKEIESKDSKARTFDQDKSSALPKESEFPPESLKLKDIAQPDLDAHRKICTEFLQHEAKLSHEELESSDRVYKSLDKTAFVVDKREEDQSPIREETLESSRDAKAQPVASQHEESIKPAKEDSPPSMIPRKIKPDVPTKSEAKKVPSEETETKQELPLEPQVSLATDKFSSERDTKIYDKESTSPSEKDTLKLQEESKLMKKDSRIPISMPKLEKEKEVAPSKIPVSPPAKSVSGEEITSPKMEKEKEPAPSKIPIPPAAKSVSEEEITSPPIEKEKEFASSKIPVSPSAKSVSREEMRSPKESFDEKTSLKFREESKPVKKDSQIPTRVATKVEKEKEPGASKRGESPTEKSAAWDRSPSGEGVTSPKKEFESRIPKPTALSKGQEKEARKDSPKEILTEIKTTEKLSSQHYQKLTSETTTKTISKTFVAQTIDAEKIFEEAETKIKQDTSVVTSKIDHKALTETKQITSSDATKEPETFFKHEQSDHKLKEKLTESTTTKETPREVLYDKQLESQKSDVLGLEEISMTLKDGKQSVEAAAKKCNKVEKDEQRLQSLADDGGTFIQATDSSLLKEREIDARLRIERESDQREPLDFDEEMKRAVINERRSEERTVSEAHVVLPADLGTKECRSEARPAGKVESEAGTVAQTPEERQEQMVKELEARNIAETIIESIQTEIAKRSASLEGIKQLDTSDSDSKDYSENTLDMDTKESEVFHDQMADDLMKKFEDIMEKRSRSQSQVLDDNEMLPERLRSVILSHEENLEKISDRGSISVSEDLTKDEESTPYDKEESFPSSSSQPKLIDRDMTMSPSSISDPIDLEVSLESEQSNDVESAKQGIERKSEEPGLDSVPSSEMDEPRAKSSEKAEQTKQIQEPIQVATIHESPAFDSLDEICQDRNIIADPIKMDFSFDVAKIEKPKDMGKAKSLANLIVRRTESDESVSPAILSPRLRLKELEIKPVNWMIGDEKIEVSEPLQPSQAFDKELEEYQRSLARQRSRTSSRDGSVDEQESVTRSSEDVSTVDSVRETFVEKDSSEVVATTPSSKFTVTAVPEQDFESELVENRLDISCQELIDTLKREYEAKTPTEDRDESKYTYDSEKAEKGGRKTPDFSARVDPSLESTAPEETGDASVGDVSIEVPKLLVEDKTEAGEPEEAATTETRLEEKAKEPELEPIAVSSEPAEKKEEIVAASRRTVDEAKSDVSLRGLKQTSPSKARKTYSDESKAGGGVLEIREKVLSSDKGKKEDLPSVDLSARYAITVLDQVVKKEIAEVKESLEAAKQDLIEELSENSETVFQIKDSPSEFQFKLEPETIPNDLPFLYKAPSFEQVEQKAAAGKPEGSPVAKPRRVDPEDKAASESEEKVSPEGRSKSSKTGDKSFEEKSQSSTDSSGKGNFIKILETSDKETSAEATATSQPVAATRSSSDAESKDEGATLLTPQPAPRRRPKPARTSKKVTSESDAGSSSGDSSNYQSCDYEIGSGSRPSSSDIEALHSTLPSGTVSEYETALMSIEHSSASRPTSQEYQSAVSTLSSRESMKSLNSLSSGHLGSIDSAGELSETLVASEAEDEQEEDGEKDQMEENLEGILDEDKESDSSSSEIAMDDAFDKTSDDLPCRMKRSSEMIFQQIMDEAAAEGEEATNEEEGGPEEETRFDECTTEQLPSDTVAEDEEAFRTDSIFMSTDLTSEAYDKSFSSMESKTDVPEVLIEGVAPQTDAPLLDTHLEAEEETEAEETRQELLEFTTSTEADMPLGETDVPGGDAAPGSIGTLLHQASTTSSTSGAMSFETVIEKDQKLDRHSPDSDSFELVDKPDIIDDFVVIEEVGREAEEFDSEGKSISIGSTSQSINKKYDRELENLIAAETKDEGEAAPTSQALPRNNELFDFESEESPPMASNADDQYSQSLSDDENFEGSKKWMEMQFQADPRGYDLDYDRGRLEDIKEEEITDFEAGSSRFGSLGSHKGSIGSVGSMRGSYGSATDFDVLAGKKTFSKPIEHDNVSLSSLQEFESLESAVAMENSRKLQCGSQESVNNGSLPRRYVTSRSGHGDDISLSSLKDFEGLEKACREAHLIELRAREEEDLLDHESPENRYKLENLPRPKAAAEPVSATGSFNPSTSGSDDYEKRIMEIDEIIRIAQANVEKFDRQDDTTEDISQIEITADAEKVENVPSAVVSVVPDPEREDSPPRPGDTNLMETSTDSLELEENVDKKHNPLCRSSDSLEMKTTIDFPSLSSDSLNNVRDPRETQIETSNDRFGSNRRISSDSLEMPLVEQQPDADSHDKSSDNGSYHLKGSFDDSVEQTCSTTDTKITNNGKTRSPSMSES